MPGVTVTRDIQYGPADRNLLDMFVAEGASGSRPVLVFVHGGGFTGGNKSTPGSPFYDNVPLWAARNGLVGVNITYRLAPQHPWPAGPEDVGAALRWVADNISNYGGDPSKVVLFGHSAGATHAGTYAAMPQFHGPKGIGIAGLILTSGIYDLTDFPVNDGYRSYIGDDTSLYAARSPIGGPEQARRCRRWWSMPNSIRRPSSRNSRSSWRRWRMRPAASRRRWCFAKAQPSLARLCDRHRRHRADRADPGFCEGPEIARQILARNDSASCRKH